MPTDEELIGEIRQGSQAAMEVLVKRHYKTVFAYLYRKTADYHISLDLTQETLLKMMRSLPAYSFQGKFGHWLLTIAVNVCRDYYRSRQYRDRQSLPLESCIRGERGDNVEDFFHRNTRHKQIQAALQELPEPQREAIILRYYHELRVREIAGATHSNEAAIKSRLYQGIRKLKQILQGRTDYGEQNE